MKNYRPSSSFAIRVILSRFFSVGIAACLVGYTLLMVSTISLINERKDIQASIRSSQVAISDLEIRYFELAKSIDTETIKNLGFTHTTTPYFAYTQPEHRTVALR